MLESMVLSISYNNAPIRISRVKDRCNPWINTEIIKTMYQRDYTHDKAVNIKSDLLWGMYKELRNKVTSMIRDAKKDYFENLSSEYNDTRKYWKELRRLICDKRNNNQVPSFLDSNIFNKYFANIGNKVAKSIARKREWKWKHPKSIYTFKFNPIKVDSVLHHLTKLDSGSHMDVLDVDARLLRAAATVLAPSLTHLLNISIKFGFIPTFWKFDRVTHVYKGKSPRTDKGNYRPISLLRYACNIMEKEIQAQIFKYFIENDFISIDQFAFQKNNSTLTFLHRVVDDWLEAINESEIVGICFLGIQKCFDTINHELLLEKLHKHGFVDRELKWFRNYLQDRSQAVFCNGKLSSTLELDVGVPQGSTLRPYLFLVFINDLSQNISDGYNNMFADDPCLYTIGKSVSEVQMSFQKCVTNADEWYLSNLLSVNTTKSFVMRIGSQQAIHTNTSEFAIYLNNERLEEDKSARYLGLEIDSLLK